MSGAVLLDALGTLLELEPPGPNLRRELHRRFGTQIADGDAELAIAAEIAYYRRHFDEGRDEWSLAALRLRCAEVLREAIPEPVRNGLPPARDLVASLLAALHFRVYEDVRPALEKLRARNLRLVVVSNWDVSLHDRLRELELTPMVDGIVTSAEAGARKPSPLIFEQALRLAGVSARDAIHVGDSPLEDVAGARAAGIEPVLLSRDGAAGDEEARSIATLAELVR